MPIFVVLAYTWNKWEELWMTRTNLLNFIDRLCVLYKLSNARACVCVNVHCTSWQYKKLHIFTEIKNNITLENGFRTKKIRFLFFDLMQSIESATCAEKVYFHLEKWISCEKMEGMEQHPFNICYTQWIHSKITCH